MLRIIGRILRFLAVFEVLKLVMRLLVGRFACCLWFRICLSSKFVNFIEHGKENVVVLRRIDVLFHKVFQGFQFLIKNWCWQILFGWHSVIWRRVGWKFTTGFWAKARFLWVYLWFHSEELSKFDWSRRAIRTWIFRTQSLSSLSGLPFLLVRCRKSLPVELCKNFLTFTHYIIAKLASFEMEKAST